MNNMKSISFLTAAALLAAGCMSPNPGKTVQTRQEEPVPVVSVGDAVLQKVPQVRKYSTTVQAKVVNNIVPQTASRIKEINVEIGDYVKKGQVLAKMDQTSLAQAELQLSNTRKEYERLQSLYKKGAVSTSDFETIEMQYNVSKTTFENLKENTILKSPVEGVISARNYDVQDMYAMASPIFVVEQITPVKMYVAVSERDYLKVKKGLDVKVVSDAIPGRVFKGKVETVYPTIDAATHTVTVEVDVPNADRVLRPGMYATAEFTFALEDRVVIPDTAVQKQQGSGERYVYVLEDDGTVTMKMVTTGLHNGFTYEIIDGIDAGSKVVTKGFGALRSGIKVEIAQ